MQKQALFSYGFYGMKCYHILSLLVAEYSSQSEKGSARKNVDWADVQNYDPPWNRSAGVSLE